MARFEIRRNNDEEFYFDLRADDGDVVLTSDFYRAKANAQIAIAAVRQNARLDGQFDRRVSEAGLPYFVLIAKDRRAICTSAPYTSVTVREVAIASVKEVAPTAPVAELD